MSQNPANDPNQSNQKSSQLDSLVNESLPEYYYLMEHKKRSESEEVSNGIDFSSDPSYNAYLFNRIAEIKNQFFKERDSIFKLASFHPKSITTTLIKNDNYKTQLKQKTQQLEILVEKQRLHAQNQNQLILENQYLNYELELLEQINDFKQRIRDTLSQQKPILNQEHPSSHIKTQLLKQLQQRSSAVLQKLQPYLEEHLRLNTHKNQQNQQLNTKLVQVDGKIYKEQLQRLQNQIQQHQSLKTIYNLNDQIQNERNYGTELDKYISRNHRDIEFRKSKNI